MRFWSVSTTIRNPERIRSFLKVLKEIEGEVWNTTTQGHYQVLLLQRKVFGFGSPEFEKNLSREHLSWLNSEDFTYKQVIDYKGEVSPSLHTRLSACIPLPPLRGLYPRNAPTFFCYKSFFNRKVS